MAVHRRGAFNPATAHLLARPGNVDGPGQPPSGRVGEPHGTRVRNAPGAPRGPARHPVWDEGLLDGPSQPQERRVLPYAGNKASSQGAPP